MLRDFLLQQKDLLRPYGDLDDLGYYACCAEKLTKFLKGKEIAAKNWLPNPKGIPMLLKRGSFNPPLYAEDFACVDENFLQKRATLKHLKDARNQLTEKQQLVWSYFLPSKLADFFYATNGEKPGKPLERIFIDFDRGKNTTAEQAREACNAFYDVTKDDLPPEFSKTTLVNWTGKSFHLFLFPKKPIPSDYYEDFGKPSKKKQTLMEKWTSQAQKQTATTLAVGHEKKPSQITIDPSQTPSGKLCRAPFSLHMAEAKVIDGVCVPITKRQLEEKNVTKTLEQITLRRVVERLDEYASILPR